MTLLKIIIPQVKIMPVESSILYTPAYLHYTQSSLFWCRVSSRLQPHIHRLRARSRMCTACKEHCPKQRMLNPRHRRRDTRCPTFWCRPSLHVHLRYRRLTLEHTLCTGCFPMRRNLHPRCTLQWGRRLMAKEMCVREIVGTKAVDQM